MSKKLSILILVTNDIHQDQRMQRIAHTLNKMGYEITLLGRNLDNKKKIEIPEINTHLINVPFKKGVLFYVFYMILSLVYLFRKKPDWIYSVDPDTLLSSTIYSKIKGKTLIYDSHEYFSKVPELINKSLKQTVWNMVENWGVRQASLLLTVGDELAAIFSKKHLRTFHAILNVNLMNKPFAFKERNNFEDKLLLYQGMLNEGRGLRELILAMDHLKDWSLRIIGKGDLEEDLRALAMNGISKDRIEFLGFINPEALVQYTKVATLGINLLDRISESYYYSLANKTFDYMNAGVPALHMNFPEYQNIQDTYHCFLLVDQLNVIEIVHKIKSINAKSYSELVSNNLNATQHFSWEKESEKLEKLIRSIEI